MSFFLEAKYFDFFLTQNLLPILYEEFSRKYFGNANIHIYIQYIVIMFVFLDTPVGTNNQPSVTL